MGSFVILFGSAVSDIVTSPTTESAFSVRIEWLTVLVLVGVAVLVLLRLLRKILLKSALRAVLTASTATGAVEAASEAIGFVLPLTHSLDLGGVNSSRIRIDNIYMYIRIN